MQTKKSSTRSLKSLTYIGKTGSPFIVRMKEHQCAVRHEDIKNANVVHGIQKSHSIDWENARIIDRAKMEAKEDLGEPVHQNEGELQL